MAAMTAARPTAQAARLNLTHFVPLALATLLIVCYAVLPWMNQPELGPTPATVLTATRANNEIGITTNGLVLVPLGAIIAAFAGMWTIAQPRVARGTRWITAVAGLIALSAFVIAFRHAAAEEIDLAGAAGAGFWLALAGSVALIGQVILPHIHALPVTKTLGNQESVLLFALLLMTVVIGIANPRYVAERNLSDVLQGNAYIAVAAVGMAMVIISGNIDISVGSLIGVLATVSGSIAVWQTDALSVEMKILLAWTVPCVVGGLVGAVIGFLVAFLRIPSIIVTLGFLSILKGGLIIVTGGNWIDRLPSGYAIAQMRPAGIPMPIIFMVVVTVIGLLFLRYSPAGRAIYAVGGNREAARLSGISERRTIMMVFILNGVIAGVAAVLYATQLSVIQSTVPPNLELLIITATVVGGVSILGGTGTVLGAALAAIILNAIRSSMVFVNVSPFWLQAVQGLLILLTVLADLVRRRRQII